MSFHFAQADGVRIPLPDSSVDFVFGSPPYMDARLYLEDGRDLGIARDCAEWVEWMLVLSREAVRVSRGAVLWVCAGKTSERNYRPGPEGLIWKWFESGGFQECPCYWRRFGIQGSGGDQWFRKDVEYVVAFKRSGKLPWNNNTAMGVPCKFGIGGRMTNRQKNGKRCTVMSFRDKSGRVAMQHRTQPEIANPGNLVDTGATGGGHLGHAAAHENEAPFPEALAEWFVKSLCPPGGTVLDPFSGSGTTAAVADRLGRHGIGLDIRRSQCELGKLRCERPHAPVKPMAAKEEVFALKGLE